MSEAQNELFAGLFVRTRAALHRYVVRLGRTSDSADEIVQEAFTRTFKESKSVEAPAAFLYSTARNLAWKARRHERIARTESVADVEELGTTLDGSSVENALIAEERSRILREAIARLPPQCRAAFTLKVFHACPYQEIADQLGISAKTVEKHVSRGLRETHAYLRRRYRSPGENHG